MTVSEKKYTFPQLERPLLVWDGDCGFCKRCVRTWRRWTKGAIDDCTYQSGGYPKTGPYRPDFQKRIYLFEPNGYIYSGAAAAFRSLQSARLRFLDRWYRSSPRFAALSERAYAFVAKHRSAFSKVF
ncbi:DCC1-like thiol-disulfide oxidoreductase family protein [Pelagicoccus sp. SDUM812005]|uniref:thiol-disulfide oxidoreductase DCC family protein n=1 Tax=Pelagicoccus sp. SDUM812005 TaxID=3041257 RepID=UPI00280D786C|nr:DCC1-like thiol-disulfide oxidoreductase family protein [Pelagicoccus sp. SDUM812005]MDQ8181094.1 DCC1-like thiol-disulfide oxidoreductase family protein [Pelagicoccus sp. SDUM812005]